MTATTSENAKDVEKLRVNEKKWSKPLWDAGWTAIPTVFIERQAAFGLDAIDMNIFVHLAHYWWHPDKLPYPSVKTIAAAIGLKPRAVQNRLRKLEAANFIQRHQRKLASNTNDTNLYSFKGLIAAATPYAEEILKKKVEAIENKKKLLASKKPKLVINNSEK